MTDAGKQAVWSPIIRNGHLHPAVWMILLGVFLLGFGFGQLVEITFVPAKEVEATR